LWDSQSWLSFGNEQMSPKEQTTEQQNHFTLGIDVGGTKIAAGLVDTQGKILYQTRVPNAPLAKMPPPVSPP